MLECSVCLLCLDPGRQVGECARACLCLWEGCLC